VKLVALKSLKTSGWPNFADIWYETRNGSFTGDHNPTLLATKGIDAEKYGVDVP
jgi:hypothetical protein